jgi:hypothetical protein
MSVQGLLRYQSNHSYHRWVTLQILIIQRLYCRSVTHPTNWYFILLEVPKLYSCCVFLLIYTVLLVVSCNCG